ncbi:hypothetical protein QJ527_12265 [Enterococcus mundtii]|uniref:rolling circle replication-associated protein n=1 Tax=Enterococcus TaxID=1350 RepID=UPI0025433D0E|nr:hypothetical protein [Enterococcus mundtii]MDK4212307.1 hypothetical protein [Enterococcus mundtii]
MKQYIKSKQKLYPDGSKQITIYQEPKILYRGTNYKSRRKESCTREAQKEEERYKKKLQAKNKIIDYIKCNQFKYFWTLTFSMDYYDDKYFDIFADWLKKMKRRYGKFDYIFIPERSENGRIHFHGVSSDIDLKKFEWTYGTKQIEEIKNEIRIGMYITKGFNSKEEVVLKGKKRYWCSKGLKTPIVEQVSEDLTPAISPQWISEDGRVTIYYLFNIRET